MTFSGSVLENEKRERTFLVTSQENHEAHRNAENFQKSKYFQNPNPGMIFSRVESLCTTHSNLKNIKSRTQRAWPFSRGKPGFGAKNVFFCASRHLCL
jgi:hypothetical protein